MFKKHRSEAFQDELSSRPAWWLKSPRPEDRSFDLADGEQGSTVKRLHSTASEARLRYEDDMAGCQQLSGKNYRDKAPSPGSA